MSDDTKIDQLGIYAPHSHFESVGIKQEYRTISSDVDLSALADELRELRAVLEKNVSEPSQYGAIGDLMSAEQAARAEDRVETSKRLGRLKAFGKWALDGATTIGTGLAEAAIKATIGLP